MALNKIQKKGTFGINIWLELKIGLYLIADEITVSTLVLVKEGLRSQWASLIAVKAYQLI